MRKFEIALTETRSLNYLKCGGPDLGGKISFTTGHLNEFATNSPCNVRNGLALVLIEKRFLNLTQNLS